jgi:hypothetical protein
MIIDTEKLNKYFDECYSRDIFISHVRSTIKEIERLAIVKNNEQKVKEIVNSPEFAAIEAMDLAPINFNRKTQVKGKV